METDSNENIQKLRAEGRSLREIASILGVSHVAVLKRLRANQIDRELVTSDTSPELPSVLVGNEMGLTVSNACASRGSQESEEAVNQVVTKHPPSPDKGGDGNPAGNTLSARSGASERGTSDPPVDLCGAIKEFLESKGIEVYRMQVGQEAYQVEHKGQVIRMYVQRKDLERVP